ncbi:hypothetical protein [Streptomyces sp. NRRL B-3648]|uniref:hypothetical protein n=1 Tax=Streptomyces sp. NRRL B-3648 TaxID=1519493 RepID=UPI00131C1977|nr:hypothetical protein [Streptomyces sp. NRRL B-3648]
MPEWDSWAVATCAPRVKRGKRVESVTCLAEPDTKISCTPQRLRDAAVLGLEPGLSVRLGHNGSACTAGDVVTVPLTVRIEGGTARWTGPAGG